MNLLDIAVNGYKPTPKELPSFQGVGKNQRASLQITTGATFQMIELVSNITDASKILKVEIELNGNTIYSVTGQDLKALFEPYLKRSRDAGRYVINFFNPEAKTLTSTMLGQLVTFPTDSMTLYVEFGETGATVPELRARAHLTKAESTRWFIPKTYSINIDASVAGENSFIWPTKSGSQFIRRLHFMTPNISKLKVIRDDLTVYEARAIDNKADLAEGGDNAPVDGVFHFDPAHIGYQLEGAFAVLAQKELRFTYEVSQAGGIRVVCETIDQVYFGRAAA